MLGHFLPVCGVVWRSWVADRKRSRRKQFCGGDVCPCSAMSCESVLLRVACLRPVLATGLACGMLLLTTCVCVVCVGWLATAQREVVFLQVTLDCFNLGSIPD